MKRGTKPDRLPWLWEDEGKWRKEQGTELHRKEQQRNYTWDRELQEGQGWHRLMVVVGFERPAKFDYGSGG